jgi:hypothetical protein
MGGPEHRGEEGCRDGRAACLRATAIVCLRRATQEMEDEAAGIRLREYDFETFQGHRLSRRCVSNIILS